MEVAGNSHLYVDFGRTYDGIKRSDEWVNRVVKKAVTFSIQDISEIKNNAKYGDRSEPLLLQHAVLFTLLVDLDMRGDDVHRIRSGNVTFVAASDDHKSARFALLHVPASKNNPTGAFRCSNRAVCACVHAAFAPVDQPCEDMVCQFGVIRDYFCPIPDEKSMELNFIRAMNTRKTKFISGILYACAYCLVALTYRYSATTTD